MCRREQIDKLIKISNDFGVGFTGLSITNKTIQKQLNKYISVDYHHQKLH
jgi:hypothetical protein